MPETLISALVWGFVDQVATGTKIELVVDDGEAARQAVAYDRYDQGGSRLDIGYTLPAEGTKRRERLVDALWDEFDFANEHDARDAAQVLVRDLRALRPTKSKTFAAVPIDLYTALLQDSSGLLRTRGPANYAAIFERMFALGGGGGSAAQQLVSALSREGEGHPKWLSSILGSAAPAYVQVAGDKALEGLGRDFPAPGGNQPAWLAGRNTPYTWFARSWVNLCENGWTARMPRRRWVDWASSVLRTSLGMGYLFEMNLVRTMVLSVGDERSEEAVLRAALADGQPLLRWDDTARVSDRCVREQVRGAAREGTAAAKLLEGWIQSENCPSPSDHEDQQDGLGSWLQVARAWANERGIKKTVREIAAAMEGAGDLRPAKNVDETILYSLRERSEGPSAQDHYALLNRRGRYFVVDPGQEWLVALGGLASTGPSKPIRVADIADSLASLRLQPPIPSIIRRLEASGLARGSHDADEAIEVQASF
ncbi:hypothetical protein N8I71_17815 [Roseibacterium sp. SDUM158016]|uniref:hypothetical protein n=1 Tax=Roseicyclus sediminis TaxID=2980997 RepID=UPI0021D0E06B|nr:hypothetical protein [Roseibacterium sp. SDUM158016]MCU4654700.1 hypothetical protein [Roseibacterium sp. SDUM158016]